MSRVFASELPLARNFKIRCRLWANDRPSHDTCTILSKLGHWPRILGCWPSFLGQDPFFFLLDSDFLDFLPYVTFQTSKWHPGGTKWPILDMCFQRALWSDAKHESVLWNHPECSPAITAIRFAPSTKTSFSWQKLCFYAPVYVSCVPTNFLVLELWSCFKKFECRGGTGFGP